MTKVLLIAAVPTVLLIIGLAIGYYGHPYEYCKSRYETYEEIQECMYLLKMGK